jgi:alpha-D-xyloside xylohydrolase
MLETTSERQSTERPIAPAIVRQRGRETLRVEPWGRNSVRVRVSVGPSSDPGRGALLEPLPSAAGLASPERGTARLVVDELTVDVDEGGGVRFSRASDGRELLAEEPIRFLWPGARSFKANGNGYYRIEQLFRAYPGEQLFGLGQHQHGRLDQKGIVVDLEQSNAEVSIPFLVSNRGYGLLWNNPAVGRVELGGTGTRWVADSAQQIDYWFTIGSPSEIAAQYAEATGHAPTFPAWAAGFWQSKLRYRTQEELLAVAREYNRRGLPLSVIVCDFFHWPHQGDWCFEPSEWPDPEAMVRELADMGVKLMVSVWPSVASSSSNYQEMQRDGLFIATERGTPFHIQFPDRGSAVAPPVSFYDSTNPEARAYLWEKLRENYHALGIDVFWLDACEPEIEPGQTDNLHLHAGPGPAVINRYPLDHAQAVHDGLRDTGEEAILTFCRSAWAGSQRYGAALWSGDIAPTFEALAAQIPAGLNTALSGIPWWTSDIGGFHGGDPEDSDYRELVIRWFQYGLWCPIFRLHGHREPRTTGLTAGLTGGPNEAWSFGDEAYRIISELLQMREQLTPYILTQMQVAAETGVPPMRPIWFDYPHDERAWEIEDAFLFGPDVLVAPITELGARSRHVYLPIGANWQDAATRAVLSGGEAYSVEAPLERIPVFVREGAEVNLARVFPSRR